MLIAILSILVNIVYFVVLNLAIYTDRAVMPAGNIREWHRSPIDRLDMADQSFIKKYGQNTPSSKVGDECPFFNCEK